MAGYNETGTSRKEYAAKAARAYCEGAYARTQSPSEDNPYSGTQQLEEEAAYLAGFDHIEQFAAQTITRDMMQSCALPIVEVPD